MSFVKPAVRLMLRAASRYRFEGPVLSLGVPEIHATVKELAEWIPKETGKPPLVSPHEMEISTNPWGQQLGWVTARSFLATLGIRDIVSVDLPGGEHAPDLVHDLNTPLQSDLRGRFGLVLDPGTIEHVFDIKNCFFSIASALRVGGTVVHQVPIYSYNGGYYSLNPNVFFDFYRKNGFGDLLGYVIMWDRYHAYTGTHLCYEYDDAALGARHAIADRDQCRFSPHLLFFARKERRVDEFVIPMQFEGDYLGTPRAPRPGAAASFYRFVMKRLPFETSYAIQARRERWTAFARARRHSFRI